MNRPGVCVTLATADRRSRVRVQLIARYPADNGRRRYLLQIGDRAVIVRSVQLRSFSLFSHTLRVAVGLRLKRMSESAWTSDLLPTLIGKHSSRLRSAA